VVEMGVDAPFRWWAKWGSTSISKVVEMEGQVVNPHFDGGRNVAYYIKRESQEFFASLILELEIPIGILDAKIPPTRISRILLGGGGLALR